MTVSNSEILDYLQAMNEDNETRHQQLMENHQELVALLTPITEFMTFVQGLMSTMAPGMGNEQINMLIEIPTGE